MTLKLENGNCLELMKNLPDKSIDLFICDLPYGETNCKWDSKIDLNEFWIQFKRLRKSKKVACIHFCSSKFGYTLIKSNEKMFKMDMVWVKRNKTGGLQSRHRPMRNHEMVYFFYEQTPKYLRDKYHKRIVAVPKFEKDITNVYGNNKNKNTHGTNSFDPQNPASVIEEKFCKEYYQTNKTGMTKTDIYSKENIKKYHKENGVGFSPPNPASVLEEKYNSSGYKKELVDGIKNFGTNGFEPPNPASVIEEEDTMFGETKDERKKRYKKNGTGAMTPPNPASVLEEADANKNKTIPLKDRKAMGESSGIYSKENQTQSSFDPPNPASVVEEKDETLYNKNTVGWSSSENNKTYLKANPGFTPRQPASVVEEDEPSTTFKSKKVFIGKRHHQTEKPLDILEFFLKYWSDEGDTILDPTMGSGSVGVACKKLKRNFIGFELDEKIFKVAEDRIAKLI